MCISNGQRSYKILEIIAVTVDGRIRMALEAFKKEWLKNMQFEASQNHIKS